MLNLVCRLIALLGAVLSFSSLRAQEVVLEELDPPEVLLGERLFNDFRFSQYFYAQSRGDVNATLENGGAELNELIGLDGKTVEHPFKGQGMSCVACHMVEQAYEMHGFGMRAYGDYASLTPRPYRAEDPAPTTLRNTQILIMPQVPGVPAFFHWDGEFNSLTDLVVASMTGRNMGWLPTEHSAALKNLVNVIKKDNGSGSVAQDNGGYSYREIFGSSDPLISAEFRLPPEWRLDVDRASDQQIIDHLARLVAAYVKNLTFNLDEEGGYRGSPYDVFLKKNNLPVQPVAGESAADYAQRLLRQVENLRHPQFVSASDGRFETHQQEFAFGELELQGLKVFLSTKSRAGGPAGACVQCHQPPHFTDGGFHNIGVSQFQYEVVHGRGTFFQLPIPSLKERNQHPEIYGIPTEKSPGRLQRLATTPIAEDALRADLGMWNYFSNADYQKTQGDLRKILAHSLPEVPVHGKTDAELLAFTVGLMKTPTLRDLGHSAPYFSAGNIGTLKLVTNFYFAMSMLAREGRMKNIDPKLKKVILRPQDLEPLESFLRSLNEDYD